VRSVDAGKLGILEPGSVARMGNFSVVVDGSFPIEPITVLIFLFSAAHAAFVCHLLYCS